jgi:predicted PurR-regulated permease PerM
MERDDPPGRLYLFNSAGRVESQAMTQADAAPPPPAPASPRWNTATKFLVALVVLVIAGLLLDRFQQMLGPMVFAFIVAYLLNPVIAWITAKTKLSWSATVNLVYLAIVIALIGGLIAAGIAIERQAVGLYGSVVDFLPNLPDRLQAFLGQTLVVGPFKLDLATADLTKFYDQLVAAIQPALSQTGTVVGSLASGTAETLGWTLFVLVISYYLLHDLKDVVPSLEQLAPPAYVPDVRRLMGELGPVWDAFLRGQVTVSIIVGLMFGVGLTIIGVSYAPALGLLAALLVFIPVLGPTTTLIVILLVALFQPGNWLGLGTGYYVLLVFIVYTLLQQTYDNVLYPRILGRSLHLHPIVILVGAIVAASLAGIVGLLLSAPLLATLKLFGRYIFRKMFDLDPWPEPPPQPASPEKPALPRWLTKLLPGSKSSASPKSNSQP